MLGQSISAIEATDTYGTQLYIVSPIQGS